MILIDYDLASILYSNHLKLEPYKSQTLNIGNQFKRTL